MKTWIEKNPCLIFGIVIEILIVWLLIFLWTCDDPLAAYLDRKSDYQDSVCGSTSGFRVLCLDV